MNRTKYVALILFFIILGFTGCTFLISTTASVMNLYVSKNLLKSSENPQCVVSNTETAMEFYQTGEYQKALIYAEKALEEGETYDGNLDVLFTNYGDILFQLGRLEECLDMYTKALRYNPISERAFLHYTIAYQRYMRHLEQEESEEGNPKESQDRESESEGEKGEGDRDKGDKEEKGQEGNDPENTQGEAIPEDPEKIPEQNQTIDPEKEAENDTNENVTGEKQPSEGSTNPEDEQSEHSVGFYNLEDYYRSLNPEDTENINKLLFPEENLNGEPTKLP
jgi:tetratricopeptide (TPR) repeat protein